MTDNSPAPVRRTYVRRSHQLWIAIPGTLFAVLMGLVALGGIGQAFNYPIPALLCLGLSFASYRVWRLALIMDDSGITVRNWFSTETIPWNEIEEARIEPEIFWQRSPGVEFVRPGIEILLRNGRSVSSVAFDRDWGEVPDKRIEIVREVNEAIEARRGDPRS